MNARKNCSGKERTIFCYVRFEPATYPQEREPVLRYFEKQAWSTILPQKTIQHYLEDLSISKFVISPRGNGLDCHRTWEALLMGAIPVVRSSSLDALFEDLPVLIVHNWNEVTEQFLHMQHENMTKKKYKMEKLFMPYWIKRLQQMRTCCKNSTS